MDKERDLIHLSPFKSSGTGIAEGEKRENFRTASLLPYDP